MTRLGLVYSRIRTDEKMLLDAAQRRGVEVVPIFDDNLVLDIHDHAWDVDVVLERSISTWRGLYTLKFLRSHGIPAVNTYDVAARCADKAETSLLLARAGVKTPRTMVAFTPESAIQACRKLGYPAVLKPTMGSWARLLAKVDDDEMADMVLEHKEALPNPLQQVYYIQEYVATPAANGAVGVGSIPPREPASVSNQAGTTTSDQGATARGTPLNSPPISSSHRDIRAFVIGDQTVAAIHRNSPHWITNTAKGGKATNLPVTPDLNEFCLKAAQAVGGGILALDILETTDGWSCHEVNHTMEFKNSVAPTGVDIPGLMVDYCVREARA